MRLGETIYIDKFIVNKSGKKNPTVLFAPTASKDLPAYSAAFRNVYEKLGCKVNILRLFSKRKLSNKTIARHFAGADIIYVGGGDYDILLSTWKKNKIIPLIRMAYQKGVILTGLSAGCAIWYEYLIDSNRNNKTHLKKGIGMLSGAVIPHYRTANPFPLEIQKIKNSVTAIEDGCAVIYADGSLKGSISGTKGKAFTSLFPYVIKRKVVPYLQKTRKT